MARQYNVFGEALAAVKGRADSAIGTLTGLGMTSDGFRITVDYRHMHIKLDAYGDAPPEIQAFGAFAYVGMTLVHYDQAVLMSCVTEAFGSSPGEGMLGHAGTLMGNNLPRFTGGGIAGNHYIGLNLISATGNAPWRFLYSVLSDQPMQLPLGTEKSMVDLRWTVIPYSVDPWNNGFGSYGVPLWDHTADT
jgi:hypothetical protein